MGYKVTTMDQYLDEQEVSNLYIHFILCLVWVNMRRILCENCFILLSSKFGNRRKRKRCSLRCVACALCHLYFVFPFSYEFLFKKTNAKAVADGIKASVNNFVSTQSQYLFYPKVQQIFFRNCICASLLLLKNPNMSYIK